MSNLRVKSVLEATSRKPVKVELPKERVDQYHLLTIEDLLTVVLVYSLFGKLYLDGLTARGFQHTFHSQI